VLYVSVAVLVTAKHETMSHVSHKVAILWVCWICGGQIGTGIVFSLSTSTFPFQHYSTSATYSYFIYLARTPFVASVMDVIKLRTLIHRTKEVEMSRLKSRSRDRISRLLFLGVE